MIKQGDCSVWLNCLLETARTWDDKYYYEWTALSAKEFPHFVDGKYTPRQFYQYKPSAELERAHQIYLAAHYFLYDVEKAEHSFKQFKAWLK